MDESSQNKFDGQKQGTEFLRTSLPPAGAQIVSGPPLFLPPSISARSLISHFLPHIKLNHHRWQAKHLPLAIITYEH
jgi:hypothetical protein